MHLSNLKNDYRCKSCHSTSLFSPGAVPLVIHEPRCPVRLRREQIEEMRVQMDQENREREQRIQEAIREVNSLAIRL